MKYVCNAVITCENCGGFSVIFPGVEGAITQGETRFEALANAESALAEILVAYENFRAGRGEEMNNKIDLKLREMYDDKGVVTLIKVDTDEYRKNPSPDIELWYSPDTKKYFTVLTDDNIEVKPIAEKMTREVSGMK